MSVKKNGFLTLVALAFRYLRRLGVKRGAALFIQLRIFNSRKIHSGLFSAAVYIRPNTTDVETFEEIFVTGIYRLDYKIEPTSIVDLGGNIGLAAIYFAQRFPNAEIITLEPDRNNFAQLLKNTMHYSNIRPLNMAIGSHKGVGKVISENLGASGIQVAYLGFEQSDNCSNKTNELIFTSLSDLMSDLKLDHIDILKIDIEGGEIELFSSNFEFWLVKTHAIAIETHDRIRSGASKTVLRALINFNFNIEICKSGFLFTKVP